MSLLKGFHKHHITPKYMGGSDSPENLVLLHPIDHAIAHLVRYKMFGNIRDLWASNWLQGIKSADVYTQWGKEREKKISERRAQDADFDKHIKNVRSKATANRKEGYQVQCAEIFKKRMKDDKTYAKIVKNNRRTANKLSLVVRRKAAEHKATLVRAMRAEGKTYAEIQQVTKYSLGAISNIINNKMLVGVGRGASAGFS